jgi:hypothetical protein
VAALAQTREALDGAVRIERTIGACSVAVRTDVR